MQSVKEEIVEEHEQHALSIDYNSESNDDDDEDDADDGDGGPIGGSDKTMEMETKTVNTSGETATFLNGTNNNSNNKSNWMPMLSYLCMLNKCTVKELQVLLTNLECRRWMIDHLRHCQIYTTYLCKRRECYCLASDEVEREVRCNDLSAQNANVIYAFRGYLSITVGSFSSFP